MDESTTITPALPDRGERIIRTAADAALAVAGVHHLGTPASRVLAGVRATATGRDAVPGVRVATRLDGVEVVVSVVTDYPVDVTVVAGRVRDAVASALTAIGAADVIVAVVVTDVHGPFDRDEPAPTAAVEADAAPEAVLPVDVRAEPDVLP